MSSRATSQRQDLNANKPKGYTQFSKMLIFINFHLRNEGKRWVHQDYMDSLKRRDVDTPRSYSIISRTGGGNGEKSRKNNGQLASNNSPI